MKTISFITFIALLFGCQSNTFKMDGIESIKIVTNQKDQYQDTVIITDREQIKELSSIIKNAKREPVKFLADYRVELDFKDRTVVLLVRNDLLNNQGLTYKLKKDLGKKLEAILQSRR